MRHARPMWIGSVRLEHDGDFARIELHEIPGRIDADQLHEPAHEMLIEPPPVARAEYGQNPIGRERLLVMALGSHGVVDVGDAAEHRRDVERVARDAVRIPAAVEAQVMFERDNGCERGHVRRPAQDLGAGDRMAFHDLEFSIRERVGLESPGPVSFSAIGKIHARFGSQPKQILQRNGCCIRH